MQILRSFAGVLLGAVLVVGCSSGSEPTSESDPTTSRETTSTTSGSAGDADGTSTTAAARDSMPIDDVVAALELASVEVSGQPFDVESDERGDRDAWEIKLGADGEEFKVWVSKDGTEVIDREKQEDADDDVQKLEQAKVGAIEALRVVASEYSGTFDEMEIDTHDGTLVWEIDIDGTDGTDIEVRVDATSGEILL